MSGFAASLLTTLPVLCMGIFAPSAVRWSSRWGTERSLAAAVALIGAATLLRYAAYSPALLFATALLAGVGIAVSGPLLSGFIKKHFAKRESFFIGIYSMTLMIGAALSSGLSVPLQGAFGGSWRASLAFWGWLAVATLALLLRIARQSGKPISSKAGATVGRRLPLRDSRAWLLTLFFGLVSFVYYSILAWLGPVVEALGHDRTVGGAALTLFSLVSMPVGLAVPVLMSRSGTRLLVGLALVAFELSGLILLASSGNVWAAAILLGLGAGGLFPVALTLPVMKARSPEEAGAWSAMTQSGGYLIGAFGPLLVGLSHDHAGGYALSLIGLAVLALAMIPILVRAVKG